MPISTGNANQKSTINDLDYKDINQHSQTSPTWTHKPKDSKHSITFSHSQQTNSQHKTTGNLSAPNNLPTTLQRNPIMFF